MKKILVFSFSFIGDAVLSTAVIHPLRKHFPDAHITFLVGPRAFDILATEPNIDTTLVYDNRGEHAGWPGRLRVIKTLRHEKFDLVVNLRDSLTARCIGAEHWGMVRGESNRHAVTRYLEVLQRHGVDPTGAYPCLELTEAENTEAHRFLADTGITSEGLLIGIHPGGNWVYKLWDVEKYALVANALCKEQNAAILLFAGPNERALQVQVSEMMDIPPILVQTENLRHLAALISACDVYIGNDTGPMHIASAVDTPVVALFGSTNHIRSGPYGDKHTIVQSGIDLGCNPCHPGRHPGGCGAGSCEVIAGITVEQVLAAVKRYTSSISILDSRKFASNFS
ncbi:MAG: glycosyltransferase family 9 protein [Candidatus Poribacteria bacterium]|nr:glycosyltransferase family 9 protein [Candidatus Poribacteria bacterium]